MKKKFTFNVHPYSPEQNRVYLNGVDVSRMYSLDLLKSLTKDYQTNLCLIRRYDGKEPFKHYINLTFYGVKSGYSKDVRGDFNSWKTAMLLVKAARAWFTLEEPVKQVSFTLFSKPLIP